MTFENFWPLLFLAAIPIIIILYLLKPRGIDQLISSNLLWKKLLKNEQSKTFFEKFVHNILMYLQILTMVLLVVALMSPFIRMDGKSGGRKLIVMDISGSMQHVGANGKTRLEEAVEQASAYVRAEDNTQFSLIACDGTSTDLLVVDSTDKDVLLNTLHNLSAHDGGGSLLSCKTFLETLTSDAEHPAGLVIYTDADGASAYDGFDRFEQKELYVVGQATNNVANEYTVYSLREDGAYDVIASVRNYSDSSVTFDVGLYDAEDNLVALQSMSLSEDDSSACLFEGVEWEADTLSTKVSGIVFADGQKDSLMADNISHAVKSRGGMIQGVLVGPGNTFLEKAYLAVTGNDIAKIASDTELTGDAFNTIIYDVDEKPTSGNANRMLFGDARGESVETIEKAMLHMVDCDLTAGLSDFSIGVNKAYCFTLPEGAVSFLEYDGKCVGYYGERDGKKEVVVGFDMRESDFPLRAEFPVFLANSLIYLSDTSWLSSNVYYAGEEIALQPWAEPDRNRFVSIPQKAGLYQVGNEEYEEAYVVRFRTGSESDGRGEAESIATGGELKLEKVRKTLRNIFLVVVLLFLIVEWICYVKQMRYRGKFYLVVRCLVLALVLLALFGVQVRVGSNKTATIFVVDLSNSNASHLDEMRAYLSRNIEKMPKGNSYGIVTFGRDALVEQFVTDSQYYGGLMTIPEKTSTNFEDAISKALTLIPSGTNGRLVVLTDGKETRGNIQNMAQALTASRAEFLTYLYEQEVTEDAYIDHVEMPTYLHPGDKYSITVRVTSNYDTDAVLVLYHGSRQSAAYDVHLNKGSNRFVFSDTVSEEAGSNAMESVRVEVQAAGDTCAENNDYNAYSVVEAAPKILVISGEGTNVSSFMAVLNAAGCDYSAVSVINAPNSIEQMLEYRTIITANVYAEDLPIGFLNNLESYVKDYGCGFVCCGGEDSYALGGYRDTPLETVLPVNMKLKTINEKRKMAMIMIIDRSGSMSGAMDNGATNLDVAIRSACVAVDNLQDIDKVGVITFDDQFEWQVEMTDATDREAIKNKIESIDEGGGTTIKPAVQEALKTIVGVDAAAKHVVLLTDGMGETQDYRDVIEGYKNAGVTLSTVAIGDGSDTALLEKLALNCGGRYYYSDVAKDIPKIFAQEVFLGGDSYIQNGEFALAVKQTHELTANLFPEGWPLLYGYVAASEKTTANVIIAEPIKNAPILTVWQYGLGRTVAWNSDVTGEWTGGFSGKSDYVQLWKRIVDYASGNANLGEDSVNVVTTKEMTNIAYQTAEYSGKTEVLATVITPKGETQEIKLHATAPGKYETEIPTADMGLYHFNVRRMENGEIQNYVTTASAVQFSDEYKFDVSTAPYLNFAEHFGECLTDNDNIWSRELSGAKQKRSLVNILLAMAILLFLADVAMRRFQYEPKFKWAQDILQSVAQKKPGKAKVEAVVEQAMNGTGADNNVRTPVGGEINNSKTDEAGVPAKDKKTKKEKEVKKSKKPQAETLDTSQLLKKKDGRNI